jgi:hypothetical protein
LNAPHKIAALDIPSARVNKTLRFLLSVTFFVLAALLITPSSATAQTWTPLKNPPPVPDIIDPVTSHDFGPGGASFPLLLTDGSVIIQNGGFFGADGKIFKLTPDINGNYINGTWTQLATMPYIPTAAAQAVLADGRVIIEGGEFLGMLEAFLLTNKGAIYDPVTDTWTSVPPPPFFVDLFPPRAVFAPNPIGDASSVVLPDGTFMIQDKMSRQAALLNLKTLTWTQTGQNTKADLNDEEGWTLLPNGKVLTIDCYTDFAFGLIPSYPADPTNSEIYDPNTGEWSSAGSTINTLTDPILFETGPAVLRPDGTVFAVGSEGFTSIYDTREKEWSVGPKLPISPQGYQYTAQDAPGALLPNGNVLFAVSGGPEIPPCSNYSCPPVAFFEFDGHKLIPEPTIQNPNFFMAGAINLLPLPTGQVLATNSGNNSIEIYTPKTAEHKESWEPIILAAPSLVEPGKSYKLLGIRLNGMSQASMFGDEGQSATNYPLVRITNVKTGHVFYSRTHDHTSMAVASERPSLTHFDVPARQETGLSKLEVVANGIASDPIWVYVK